LNRANKNRDKGKKLSDHLNKYYRHPGSIAPGSHQTPFSAIYQPFIRMSHAGLYEKGAAAKKGCSRRERMIEFTSLSTV
jgi:hypothetical protein